MKIPANKVIYLAPGETLPGYEKLRPVPDEYIDALEELINKLNVSTQSGGLLLGLKQIYAFIDRFNKKFVSTFATCEKGCNSCCSMDVQLTPFEAEYIALSTNIPHRDSKLTTGHNSQCPFLSEKGTCSIYNYRPLLCRTYHVLSDPALCKDPSAEVMQYGAQNSNMGNFIYHTAARWVYHQTKHTFGKMDFRDIRNFFPYERDDIQTYVKINTPRPPC